MRLASIALVAALPLLAAAPPVDKGKTQGNPTAPVTIEIFSDYQCPACRSFHMETLPQLIKDFASKGKLFIVSREFPLNRTDHPYSREAAAYATAAARIGMYPAVTDAIFKDQESWEKSGKLWETIAKALTPDQQKRVQVLAKDPSVLKEVQDEANYGTSIGINQTPTLYISSRTGRFPISGYALQYSLLRSMINDMAK
jgi:protein-disulfide isomerase